jgi:hypothetical protein
MAVDWVINFYYRDRSDEDIAYRQQMVCLVDPKGDYERPVKYHSLWHWVVLTFNRTKAKVCKPFPG